MTERSYDELCKQINYEYNRIKEPSRDDLSNLSKKLNIDISIIRECLGLKDTYEFIIDKD